METFRSNYEKPSKIGLIVDKIKKLSKCLFFISIIENANMQTAVAENTTETQEVIRVEQNIDKEFKSIEDRLKVSYIPQLDFEKGPLIINIAQYHADPTAKSVNSVYETESVADSQRKVEQIILDIIKYSSKNNLKINFYNEGNIYDVSPQENLFSIIPSITKSFLSGPDENEEIFNRYVDVIENNIDKLSFHRKNNYKYGFWLRVKKYLSENENNGAVEKIEKLRKITDLKLREVNMEHVYYGGAVDKMLCDGTIEYKNYKKCEDESALIHHFKIVTGKDMGSNNEIEDIEKVYKEWIELSKDVKNPRYKELCEKLSKHSIDLNKDAEACEQREDIAVRLMVKDLETHDSDICIIVYGSYHDFKNNIGNINKTLSNKIGLIRFEGL